MKSVRAISFSLQNVVLAYYVNVFSGSGRSLFPTSVNEFAVAWNTQGYPGLILACLASLAVVTWLPVDADPVVAAAEDSAANRVSELIGNASNVDEVLGNLKSVKKARKQ
jgi:hypothetical protein